MNHELALGRGTTVLLQFPDGSPKASVPKNYGSGHDQDAPVPAELQAGALADSNRGDGAEHTGKAKAGRTDNDAAEGWVEVESFFHELI